MLERTRRLLDEVIRITTSDGYSDDEIVRTRSKVIPELVKFLKDQQELESIKEDNSKVVVKIDEAVDLLNEW